MAAGGKAVMQYAAPRNIEVFQLSLLSQVPVEGVIRQFPVQLPNESCKAHVFRPFLSCKLIVNHQYPIVNKIFVN